MKNLATATGIIATFLCSSAMAGIEWNWVNAGTGTEEGTFITEGELVDGAAPAGTYTVVDFSYDTTSYGAPIGSVSDGTFVLNQPTIGFDWDGTAPTSFWRGSGTYTNGLALGVNDSASGEPDYIGFSVGWFIVQEYYVNVFLEEYMTVTLAPVGSITETQGSTFDAVKALYR